MILSTYSLEGYGLHRIFCLAQDFGLEALSLDMDRDLLDTADAEYILSLIQMTGVRVDHVVSYDRKMDEKQLRMTLELARNIGAKKVFFYPPHRQDKDSAWYDSGIAGIQADFSDLMIALINVEPKTFLFFIPEYKDATLQSIKQVTGHTALSIANVDPESGVDLMRTAALLGSSITNVFLADRKIDKVDLFPGMGNAPIDKLMTLLSEGGYAGDFTLRITPKELGVGHIETIGGRISFMRSYIGRFFQV